jgi:hypothetical protein
MLAGVGESVQPPPGAEFQETRNLPRRVLLLDSRSASVSCPYELYENTCEVPFGNVIDESTVTLVGAFTVREDAKLGERVKLVLLNVHVLEAPPNPDFVMLVRVPPEECEKVTVRPPESTMLEISWWLV